MCCRYSSSPSTWGLIIIIIVIIIIINQSMKMTPADMLSLFHIIYIYNIMMVADETRSAPWMIVDTRCHTARLPSSDKIRNNGPMTSEANIIDVAAHQQFVKT